MKKIDAKVIFDQGLSLLKIETGIENTIRDIAITIGKVPDHSDEIKFDHTTPDGTMRKYIDSPGINDLGRKTKRSFKRKLREQSTIT